MRQLEGAIERVVELQKTTDKPLAVVLAGHNGSGKSTMWREKLADQLCIPLVNADRMMMSILPEPKSDGALVDWAQTLRDSDAGWMRVAQQGVQAFVGHAMQAKVPFAMETVFSHWVKKPDGTVESKVDLIRDMQNAGYFVLLLFVGLSDPILSTCRVQTRVQEHGHGVPQGKLVARFPRTQAAVRHAISVADAAVLVDNSRSQEQAFTTCVVRHRSETLFDLRDAGSHVPPVILKWLDVVCPLDTQSK